MTTTEKHTKTYTQQEVQNILSNLRATRSDYLILTYFRIHKITSGPLYNKYKRRFNNIIFPDVSAITEGLTNTVFLPKSFEILLRDVSEVKYISCIYSKAQTDCTPIILQFFDVNKGIQYRQLNCQYAPSELPTVLSQNGIIDKTVAYCGDYCFRDPGNVNNTSNHVSSLRLLSENNVLNLPSFDGFAYMLFEILLDYLPEDVIKPLKLLGEVMLNTSDNSVIAKQLTNAYREWKESDQNILLSNYVDYVTRNYVAIHTYLLPLRCLPYCLQTLFDSIKERFLLIFIKELYRKVHEHQLTDNNAVVYYFHLRRMEETFQRYYDGKTTFSEARKYLNNEIELISPEDEQKLDEFNKNIMKTVEMTYARALKFLEALIGQFENFHTYLWLLLTDLPVKFLLVHETYHQLKQVGTCENCDKLQQEVKVINAHVAKVPLLEVQSVVSKWVLVLKDCTVPLVSDLVQYLLSLPASYEMAQSEDREGCAEYAIRMNFAGVEDVDVVDKVEEFFSGYLDQAGDIIEGNKTPFLVE